MSKEFDEFLDSIRKEDETKTKMSKEYPEVLYCDGCEKKTHHRVKLGAIQYGCLVCNECNKMNEINQNPDE